MPAYPGFVGGSYGSQSPEAGQERTVNFYVEPVEVPGSVTKAALYPTPGVVSLAANSAGGTGRAHLFHNGREFAVIGTSFVEIPEFFSAPEGTTPPPSDMTIHGTVAIDSNPATMCGSGLTGAQIFITSGGEGYIFNTLTNTFSNVASLSGKATMGAFLDGYFVCLSASESKVYISDLNDGTTWDPTQYIRGSISSDPWVAIGVSNRYLYMFGTEVTTPWYDAGTFPIPFAPAPSGLIQYGCAAPWSVKTFGSGIYWLSRSVNGEGAVVRTGGFTPELLSTFATQYAFAQYSSISDAIGDAYQDLGHSFYILTFPEAGRTWALDATSRIWAERSTLDAATYAEGAWRPAFHSFAFGQHRVLDLEGSAVYRMSSDLYTDVDGLPIRRVRRAPILTADNKRTVYSRFELLVEPGIDSVPVEDGTEELNIPSGPHAAGNSGVFFGNWSNADNIILSNAEAEATRDPGPGTNNINVLVASDFRVQLPARATITGIVMTFSARATVNNLQCNVGPGMKSSLSPGASFSFAPGSQSVTVGTTPTEFSVGSSSELWNYDWTRGEVESASFSLGFQPATGTVATYYVSDVRVVVYATVPAYIDGAPMVMLRISNDGGRTWGSEISRSAGKVGEYSKRIFWSRCGSGRRRVFEVSFTDPIPWRILNAYVEAKGTRS